MTELDFGLVGLPLPENLGADVDAYLEQLLDQITQVYQRQMAQSQMS